MDVMSAIRSRRAVRSYGALTPDRETIRELLRLAGEAPSAMNLQPWAFVVVQDGKLMRELSSRAKSRLLVEQPELMKDAMLRGMLNDPDYDIFYKAPVLVVICATSSDEQAARDCYLAGENLMLAATGMGLGSCPIGFASEVLSESDVRERLEIPPGYAPVLPIIVGYPAGDTQRPERRGTEILHWDQQYPG